MAKEYIWDRWAVKTRHVRRASFSGRTVVRSAATARRDGRSAARSNLAPCDDQIMNVEAHMTIVDGQVVHEAQPAR